MMIQPRNKVTPFLWFNNNAEAAANFYVSLFVDSKIVDVARWRKGTHFPEGSVMSVTFDLAGQEYIAFNGGPHFVLNEALSLFVNCEDQHEVDHYWNALLADGGEASHCGWLKDRFGVTWQIVPKALGRALSDPDSARAGRAMEAIMKMVKLDVAAIEAALRA